MQDGSAVSDDDSISITSTIPSESQDEYEVEGVLAESKLNDGTDKVYYLVKWAGYPIERSTWEPEESFCDPRTLEDWRAKKEAIAQNREKPFDVDALMEKINVLEEAKALRHKRRKAKRKRLGIPVSPSSSDEESDESSSLGGFIVDDDDDDDDVGETEVKPKKKKKLAKRKRGNSEGDETRSIDSLFGEVMDITDEQAESAEPSNTCRPPSKKTVGLSSSRKRTSATDNQDVSSSKEPSHPKLSFELPDSSLATNKSKTAQNWPGVTAVAGSSSRSGVPARTAERQGLGTVGKEKGGSATSSPSLFRLPSTQRRFEKAKRRDRVPDISQLELRKPSEWFDHSQNLDVVASSSQKRQTLEDSDSLFVEQDSPVADHSLLNDSDLPPSDAWSSGETRSDAGKQHNHETVISPIVAIPPSTKNDRPGPPTRQFSNRRFWYPGEVLLTLKLGDIECDVRVCGMDPSTGRRLVQLKSKNQILLDFRDVCTKMEYTELCGQGYNIAYSNGWAVAFEDTTCALNEIVQYLRTRGVAALWYHPSDEAQLVLVAYASGSPDWNFLDENYSIPPSQGLRIVARGILPRPTSIRQGDLPINLPQSSHIAPVVPEITALKPFDVEHNNPSTPLSPSLRAQQMAPERHDVPPPLVSNSQNIDLASIFRDKFGINFKELIFVKTGKQVERVRAFYLCFPEQPNEVKEEFELVRLFLNQQKVPIFTSQLEGDWERFLGTVTSGTVLFHQSFTFYEDLPKLNKLLQQPSFNIFNISLRQPIEGTTDSHLKRLFPRGGVILMTEDFIVDETTHALLVMEWFANFAKPDWKIFFRPNIQQWLYSLFDTWKDDKIFQIYCYIKQLIPEYPPSHHNYSRRYGSPDSLDGLTDDEGQHHPFISTRVLPNYGSRSEDDHDAIPKGLSQAERDADHLIEYFAGWCLANCHKYRKFYVLTHFKPQPRWEKWHHLTITSGQKFLQILTRGKKPQAVQQDPRRRSSLPTSSASTPSSSAGNHPPSSNTQMPLSQRHPLPPRPPPSDPRFNPQHPVDRANVPSAHYQ
ncbi:hypothetical protein VTO42DRAFT_5192 [Malbranchea cinnamomea]